jgi:hypothetical protein
MARYKRKRKDGQMSNWELSLLENPDRGKWSWRSFREWCSFWWYFVWHDDRSMKEIRLIRRSITMKSWLRTPEEQRRYDEDLWNEIQEFTKESQEWHKANPSPLEGLSDEERMQWEDEFWEKYRAEREAWENRPRLRKIADWWRFWWNDWPTWWQDWKHMLKLWIFPYDDPPPLRLVESLRELQKDQPMHNDPEKKRRETNE